MNCGTRIKDLDSQWSHGPCGAIFEGSFIKNIYIYYYYIANHYTNMCKVNPKVESILTRTYDRADGQVSPHLLRISLPQCVIYHKGYD